ncbi:hypothetical protein JK358_08080 [Nocardia sp. 2]|uniref:Secreted protein n=1 Tax=Nocardia acididurans TaxID=2802282 RepID=A0ABS1M1E4_9NOCA|nr:hypothetical protein [Nocardia acididurans]MBL1074354.1 hypothetical protein [Nocardia acididurans]
MMRTRLVAAVVFAGGLAAGFAGTAAAVPNTGSAAFAQQGDRGPFTQESECLSRGNRGIDAGEWNDYDCVGGPGNWTVVPK